MEKLMMDWEFWGFIAGVVSIVIAIVIYYLQQRNNKKLVYSILTETPLLTVSEEVKGKIKITYGKKAIQNIYLVEIKIENKGYAPITTLDYEGNPIKFSFEDSEILSTEIINTSPVNLRPDISNQKSTIIIKPILLNKKDYFVVKLLFSKYSEKIEVDARIIGVEKLEQVFTDTIDTTIFTYLHFPIAAFISLLAVNIAKTLLTFFGIYSVSATGKFNVVGLLTFIIFFILYSAAIKYLSSLKKHLNVSKHR